jgi:ParB family chromosome partitioning protein
MAKKAKRTRRKKPTEPVGLKAGQTKANPPAAVQELCDQIETDGGAVLSAYREPLGGKWVVFASLPIEQVEPTPFQRNLSDAHVKRLTDVIAKTGVYLDPVIATRIGEGKYQTPNGYHRLTAMKNQNAQSIVALVVTDPQIARLILALNCEKAHNLREKCSEVIRLARHLADLPGKESDYVLEFEEPAYLTLGMCYEQNGRFAGGAYHSFLKRVDDFLERPMPAALQKRAAYCDSLIQLDTRVGEIIAQLKDKGLQSPYLRNFVVARINPVRFLKGDMPPIDEALKKMTLNAAKFNVAKITPGDLARSGGAGGAAEGEES